MALPVCAGVQVHPWVLEEARFPQHQVRGPSDLWLQDLQRYQGPKMVHEDQPMPQWRQKGLVLLLEVFLSHWQETGGICRAQHRPATPYSCAHLSLHLLYSI